MFPTTWYLIYYQTAKISKDQSHFMILEVRLRFVTVHYKPPVKSAPGQFYFIADSDRTYLQLSIDNCFKFIRHPEVELRFFEAWHVRIHKTEKTCLKVFILYTFLEQLHLENVSFQIFWSRNESWYFARSFKKDMNISNPLKSKFHQNTTFPCMYLYRKIKNADFTGGLWWTVTFNIGKTLHRKKGIALHWLP